MADITMPGMLLTGDHASRPAATAVGGGSLYACSDHLLIYQSDGATWSTWADLAGSGGGIAATIFAAKGDILTATANDTPAIQTVGANGTIPIANSAAANGWEWIALGKGKTVRTAGDLTYTSATFADVTGASITFTTGARKCHIAVVATALHSTSTFSIMLDVDVDGARLGTTTWGLVRGQAQANGRYIPMSFSLDTDALTAASHTFKLQAATDGATATLVASDPALIFSVHEIL